MEHLAMVDMDITRADMVIMMDMAKDREHMGMKTMETKIKMTHLAMITKKMSKTMMDIAMETVDTVRRADMAMETVDMVTETMAMAMEMVDTDTETMDMVKEMVDMAMETVIMVTVKVDTNTETMDMAMETVDTIMMVDMAPLMVDMAMAKMDTEEVTDIQTIQAQLMVIKVIPRVTHQDPRTVQKATADTNDYFNQTSDF